MICCTFNQKMSGTSQLPPRCPLQKKNVGHPSLEPSVINPRGVKNSNTRHHKSLLQSCIFEDQPTWLDDLLNESESVTKGIHHSRSASDPVTLFDGFVPNMLLSESNDEEHVTSEKWGNILESGCKYGPNSPRRRSNIEFSDNTVLLALSDCVSQSPSQCVEEISQSGGTSRFELKENYCDASIDHFSDTKTGKRHPGQRSRARKLQYIAELERTVDVFQTLESELAVRVSTLLQQKLALSSENKKLKQQMARLQKHKLIMDGEYQTLRNEAEQLKLSVASSLLRYVGSNESDSAEIDWQSLDWTKLHL